MVTHFGNGLVLAVDCSQSATRWCHVLIGWIAWPAGMPAPEIGLACEDAPLTLLHASFHERPDVDLAGEEPRQVRGFVMIAARPADAPDDAALMMVLDVASGAVSQPLPTAGLGATAEQAINGCDWGTLFNVLEAAGRGPGLEPLLSADFGPAGIFTPWVERLPLLRPVVEDVMGLARIEAIASPAGDAALAVNLGGRPVAGASLRVIALMPREDPFDGRGGIVPVALDGPPVHTGALNLTGYGRLAGPLPVPSGPFDLLAEVRAGPIRAWFRVTPRRLPVPAFLAALHGLHAQPANANLVEAHAWLTAVLDEREARLEGRLADLGPAHPQATDAGLIAVIHGVADPLAARFIQLAAGEIERRCTEVVVLGPRAGEVAETFLERGRIPARLEFDLAAIVRHGTYARASLVLIDPVRFADAFATGRIERIFAEPISGRSLAALSSVAAVAGSTEASDVVARLSRLITAREEGRDARLRFGRTEGVLGKLVAEHLGRLWHRAMPLLARSEAA